MTYYSDIRTLGDAPRFHARHRPNQVALVFAGRQLTYADWDVHCSRVAQGLLRESVGRGSRIAFIGKNSPEYFEVLFGGAKAGAVLVPVSWRLAPPEILYVLDDAEIEVVFVDAQFAEVVVNLAPRPRSVRRIIVVQGELQGLESYEAWRDRQSTVDPEVPCDASDVALQLYTSGTTGHPKGVQLAHRCFYALEKARAASANPSDPVWAWNVWGPDDSSLITMPCFHISGTGWGIVGLYSGARNVVLAEFSAQAVLDAVREFRITKLILVPTAIQMVLQHPQSRQTDFSSLKYLCYGASPIPLALLREALEVFGCGFIQMYGLTETTGAVTMLPAEDHDVNGNARMRSAGRAVGGVDVAILDPQGNRLPTGEVGEICIRGPTTMSGYWKQPEATAALITSDGWLRSGDAGYVDEDGYVYIQDRIKDMIVSGGVNIYPAEVENAIAAHPDVADVAVVGVPDGKWGEAVKAIIVLRPGRKPDADSVLAFTMERIARYKAPKTIDFVASLPRSASGKVLKRELRKPYWEGRSRQVN